MRHPVTLPARELFLKVAPEARVCLLPIVAGFVGADAVAVALATHIYEGDTQRIAVDIGTNGEVLLGSGLLDLVAGLLDAGIVDWTGLIQVDARDALPPKLRERVVMRGEERQVIV